MLKAGEAPGRNRRRASRSDARPHSFLAREHAIAGFRAAPQTFP